jgi:SmpA / OmlA family
MNRKTCTSWLFAACLLAAGIAQADMNEVDKRYVDQIVQGGWSTLRQVSENMVNTAYSNTEVLDVLAETALGKYPVAGAEFTTVDSVAWMCRALGASANNRYRPVMEKIIEDGSVHRKLRGHCKKALKQMPAGSNNPYVAGTVNLDKLRNAPPAPAAAKGKGKPAAPAAAKGNPTATGVDLSQIQVGMSQQQVDDLLGPPTAQTQRMTGKQWQPFNFGARDLQRMLYLYKGAGRIEFSLKSAYEGVFRVVSVTPDPNETGYP